MRENLINLRANFKVSKFGPNTLKINNMVANLPHMVLNYLLYYGWQMIKF